MIGDSGAYASVGGKVLERAAGHACGPYRVPNVDIESMAVYTNNPPCGAMRGFGANQAHFAMEGCMDLLAAQGRASTAGRCAGATRSTSATCSRPARCSRSRSASGRRCWPSRIATTKRGAQGRAVGIACGLKNSGIGNGADEWGKARLVVERDGTISLYNGYTEMGQGLFTVLDAVRRRGDRAAGRTVSGRRSTPPTRSACGQTTGSRATLFGGRAVSSAAEKLRADLDRGLSLADLAGRVYAADVVVDDTTAARRAGAERSRRTRRSATPRRCASSTARGASSASSRRTTSGAS